GARDDPRRQVRCADQAIPGRALYRFRVVRARGQADDLGPVVRARLAGARRRDRDRRDRAPPRRHDARRAADRRFAGVVMTNFVLLAVLLAVIALLIVLRPLWREARGLAIVLAVL